MRLLRLLLSQYDVGTIPPVLDAVQMGPVDAMRCNRQKHLIVLGAEEGKLPGYSGSTGVLTDQERVQLRSLGVPLTGGSVEGIQAEFAEIYGVFCGARQSILVSCAGEQPSFLYHRLAKLAGGETETVSLPGFAQADGTEAGAYLARWDAESLAERLDVLPGYRETECAKGYTLGKVARNSVEGLYGRTLNLSASPDRPAGGVSALLFPEIRSSGPGTEAGSHRPGGIRHLCPCGVGKYRPVRPGYGGIPPGNPGRNHENCP